MPESRATLRHYRASASKVREVLGLIRGRDAADAREILRFSERSAAREVGKLLDSAIANAENNEELPPDELFVSRCWADEGPTMKRWRPRARGRATRIRKRSSHVTIVVARYSDDELRRRQAREDATGGTDRRRRLARRRRVAGQTAAAARGGAESSVSTREEPTSEESEEVDGVSGAGPTDSAGSSPTSVPEAIASDSEGAPIAEQEGAEDADADTPDAELAADDEGRQTEGSE